jgi:hypothetical protein
MADAVTFGSFADGPQIGRVEGKAVLAACRTYRDARAGSRIGARDSRPTPDIRRMSNFRLIDRDTGFLMPPSVDEWLPERHLARFIVEVLGSSWR